MYTEDIKKKHPVSTSRASSSKTLRTPTSNDRLAVYVHPDNAQTSSPSRALNNDAGDDLASHTLEIYVHANRQTYCKDSTLRYRKTLYSNSETALKTTSMQKPCRASRHCVGSGRREERNVHVDLSALSFLSPLSSMIPSGPAADILCRGFNYRCHPARSCSPLSLFSVSGCCCLYIPPFSPDDPPLLLLYLTAATDPTHI